MIFSGIFLHTYDRNIIIFNDICAREENQWAKIRINIPLTRWSFRGGFPSCFLVFRRLASYEGNRKMSKEKSL